MSTKVYSGETTAPPATAIEAVSPPARVANAAAAPGSGRALGKAKVLLILAGLLAYGNAFNTQFHMDDAWMSAKEIADLWEFVGLMPQRALAAATLYFNNLLHEDGWFGYHLVNIAIHFAATLTLFGVVRRTLLLPRWQGRFSASALWLAFAVALLWMVHPLQTQSVTYIIQRMESMMGLFYLLTFYCVLRGAQAPLRRQAWLWYVAAVLSCALGALSKEVMITILPVLLGYDFVFLGAVKDKPRWRFSPLRLTAVNVLLDVLRRRWLLYLALAGICAWMVLRHLFRKNTADVSAGFGIASLQQERYWMTQAWVLLYYVRLCFIPYPQFMWYRGPEKKEGGWEPTMWTNPTDFAEFLPAALILAGLGLIIVVLTLRRSWLGFVGWWFFGVLSLTSIVPMSDAIFEHRLYLSLAALSCLVVMGGYLLFNRFLDQKRSLVGMIVVTIALATTLTFLTIMRNEDYRSNEGIWATVGDAQNSRPCSVVEMIFLFWYW